MRPPSEEWELLDRPDADSEPAESPELADASHASSVEPGDMKQAAVVASRFAVEFTGWHYDEVIVEREARLIPFLTERAQGWLAGGSSALVELEDQRRRREVTTAELAFVEPIEVDASTIEFHVVVRVTVSDTAGRETIEHSLPVRGCAPQTPEPPGAAQRDVVIALHREKP